VTLHDGRISQIAVGRDWFGVNLVATWQGLSLHPLLQASKNILK